MILWLVERVLDLLYWACHRGVCLVWGHDEDERFINRDDGDTFLCQRCGRYVSRR